MKIEINKNEKKIIYDSLKLMEIKNNNQVNSISFSYKLNPILEIYSEKDNKKEGLCINYFNDKSDKEMYIYKKGWKQYFSLRVNNNKYVVSYYKNNLLNYKIKFYDKADNTQEEEGIFYIGNKTYEYRNNGVIIFLFEIEWDKYKIIDYINEEEFTIRKDFKEVLDKNRHERYILDNIESDYFYIFHRYKEKDAYYNYQIIFNKDAIMQVHQEYNKKNNIYLERNVGRYTKKCVSIYKILNENLKSETIVEKYTKKNGLKEGILTKIILSEMYNKIEETEYKDGKQVSEFKFILHDEYDIFLTTELEYKEEFLTKWFSEYKGSPFILKTDDYEFYYDDNPLKIKPVFNISTKNNLVSQWEIDENFRLFSNIAIFSYKNNICIEEKNCFLKEEKLENGDCIIQSYKKNIKHGPYKMFKKDGVKIEGMYINGHRRGFEIIKFNNTLFEVICHETGHHFKMELYKSITDLKKNKKFSFSKELKNNYVELSFNKEKENSVTKFLIERKENYYENLKEELVKKYNIDLY